jgi:mannose-6-phosphate isomerase-like protein (cupin superfamily)
LNSQGDVVTEKQVLVHYEEDVDAVDCPYGSVRRVVTGGAGGVANVHVVEVSRGTTHYHEAYDEIYYVLSGRGELVVDGERYSLRPGAVAVIPRGAPHSLCAAGREGEEGKLKFIIFGSPAMPIDDERAAPRK